MGLFDMYCPACGKKLGYFLRYRLADGEIICDECHDLVPQHMRGSVFGRYTIDDFIKFKEYVDYSKEHFRPIFRETNSYYTIHLDVPHRLFYIGQNVDCRTVFFRLRNVEQFDLVFNAKDYRSGLLGEKVNGDILMQLEVDEPYFYYEDKLRCGIEVKAKKQLFGSKVVYDNPEGMAEFYTLFLQAVNASLEEYRDELLGEDDESGCTDDSYTAAPPELQQAMALFMLDSLEDVTLADVRALRNRMIKTFHPDKGSADDTKYAQRINNAYEVLKEYLE